MIIVKLLGGLGNQMFQYAAGLALASARRTVLKLDVSWFRELGEHEGHNRYSLGCFNICEQFATSEEIDRIKGSPLTRIESFSARLARTLHLYRYANSLSLPGAPFVQKEPADFDPVLLEQPDNTYLDGMWQSPRYFESIKGLLQMHFSFRYPVTPTVDRVIHRIRDSPSAALHFRRGDYVRNPEFNRINGVVRLQYYYEAIQRILARDPRTKFYIFSDDIESVRSEFAPTAPHEFVDVTEPWHAWDKIRMMSACDHIAIANSTFSWWAAWLNHSPKRLVIAPDPWFAQPPGGRCDIIPDAWLKLAAY
jgi:hypothetical protein